MVTHSICHFCLWFICTVYCITTEILMYSSLSVTIHVLCVSDGNFLFTMFVPYQRELEQHGMGSPYGSQPSQQNPPHGHSNAQICLNAISQLVMNYSLISISNLFAWYCCWIWYHIFGNIPQTRFLINKDIVAIKSDIFQFKLNQAFNIN